MRFWQKTYILTLILFLFCLYLGLFSLAFYTYGKNVQNMESVCRAEQDYLLKSFERDYAAMTEAGSASPSLLMESYGSFYRGKQVLLQFGTEDSVIYSTFPKDTEPDSKSGTLTQIRIGGKRYVLITSDVCDGNYVLLYAKDASSLDEEFRALMITYAAVAAAVSLVLAIALLFLLKKLSLPLQRLQKATEAITSGDRTVRADESGKDEFADLGKSFNQMVETIDGQMQKLAEDAERKQMLVDNMAHEMRTPLTSIRGYAEYIEKAAVPEEEKNDAAGRIVRESDRLKKISEKILDTAFLRNNPVKREPVDLSFLLAETKERLSGKAEACGVTVRSDLQASHAEGDPVLLSLLFDNLTENAIKSCAEGGTVTLSSSGRTVTVSDDGKGMTKEQLSHITEPFYRTDKSRSRAEGGAGLGLALCRQIVSSHGAEMTFESEPGKGTQVFLKF
ncbi:MAG: HAMP domain-containing histidine kinase [Clostridia bacterium]|nr:HAMP domain-containing histidine kinase [Clostridia bacterium]